MLQNWGSQNSCEEHFVTVWLDEPNKKLLFFEIVHHRCEKDRLQEHPPDDHSGQANNLLDCPSAMPTATLGRR